MVYTTAEIQNHLSILPHVSFALGFSCKEAFFKAFGVSWTNSEISWKDIELLFDNQNNLNNYSIRLGGYAKKLYRKLKCSDIRSSLYYNNEYVVFKVILIS